MTHQPTDFIIKKRRKRIAVDPCLGFYPESVFEPERIPSHYETVVTSDIIGAEANLAGQSVESDEPAIAASPNTSGIPATHVVSVEDFLRRSTGQRPARTYGRKRKRESVVGLDNAEPFDPSDDNESSSTPQLRRSRLRNRARKLPPSSSPDCTAVGTLTKRKKSRKRRAQPRKVKTITQSLLEAALLSHGDPVDSLLNPNAALERTSSRPPLKFVAKACGPKSPKHRSRSLVDPRKVAPFRLPSFSSCHNSTSSPMAAAAKCKPITGWMIENCNPHPQPSLGVGNKSKDATRPPHGSLFDPLNCRPLSFVPVQDAEETYSKLRPANRESYSANQDTFSTKFPLPLLTSRAPLDFISPLSTAELESRTSQNPLALKDILIPSVTMTISEAHTSPPGRIITADIEGGDNINNSATSSPFFPTNISSAQSRITSNNALPIFDPQQSFTTNKIKTLKPLASFLDQFLETVRDATHVQASITTRLRRRTGLRNCQPVLQNQFEGSVTTETSILQGANFKSLEPSTRNAGSFHSQSPDFASFSAHSWSSSPSCQRTATRNCMVDDIVENDQELTRNSSQTTLHIPDILAALQPQPYQVVLSPNPYFTSTATEGLPPDDIETWGSEDDHNAITPVTPSANIFAGLDPRRLA